MSAAVIDSDTPFSKGRATGQHAYYLANPEEGRGVLAQYRAEIAEDMAHSAILVEKDEFCDQYFPVPSVPDPNKPRPTLPHNPFQPLANFRGSEAKLCEEFVSGVIRASIRPGPSLNHPLWVTDQEIDLARHIVAHRLPEPGGMAELVTGSGEAVIGHEDGAAGRRG